MGILDVYSIVVCWLVVSSNKEFIAMKPTDALSVWREQGTKRERCRDLFGVCCDKPCLGVTSGKSSNWGPLGNIRKHHGTPESRGRLEFSLVIVGWACCAIAMTLQKRSGRTYPMMSSFINSGARSLVRPLVNKEVLHCRLLR